MLIHENVELQQRGSFSYRVADANCRIANATVASVSNATEMTYINGRFMQKNLHHIFCFIMDENNAESNSISALQNEKDIQTEKKENKKKIQKLCFLKRIKKYLFSLKILILSHQKKKVFLNSLMLATLSTKLI